MSDEIVMKRIDTFAQYEDAENEAKRVSFYVKRSIY